MKAYEITCEGMVSRTIYVDDASSLEDAINYAREEFSLLVGARKEDVEIADIYSEPVDLKEIKND
tara:strand:- start:719 stop:913 length:195 start_codon:yes stop_codon:yes gene_type:complete